MKQTDKRKRYVWGTVLLLGLAGSGYIVQNQAVNLLEAENMNRNLEAVGQPCEVKGFKGELQDVKVSIPAIYEQQEGRQVPTKVLAGTTIETVTNFGHYKEQIPTVAEGESTIQFIGGKQYVDVGDVCVSETQAGKRQVAQTEIKLTLPADTYFKPLPNKQIYDVAGYQNVQMKHTDNQMVVIIPQQQIKATNELKLDVSYGTATSKLEVTKLDENGNRLVGHEFTLYDENGVEVAQDTTDKDGKVLFKEIPTGDYQLQETKRADNLTPSSYVQKIAVTEEEIGKKLVTTNRKSSAGQEQGIGEAGLDMVAGEDSIESAYEAKRVGEVTTDTDHLFTRSPDFGNPKYASMSDKELCEEVPQISCNLPNKLTAEDKKNEAIVAKVEAENRAFSEKIGSGGDPAEETKDAKLDQEQQIPLVEAKKRITLAQIENAEPPKQGAELTAPQQKVKQDVQKIAKEQTNVVQNGNISIDEYNVMTPKERDAYITSYEQNLKRENNGKLTADDKAMLEVLRNVESVKTTKEKDQDVVYVNEKKFVNGEAVEAKYPKEAKQTLPKTGQESNWLYGIFGLISTLLGGLFIRK